MSSSSLTSPGRCSASASPTTPRGSRSAAITSTSSARTAAAVATCSARAKPSVCGSALIPPATSTSSCRSASSSLTPSSQRRPTPRSSGSSGSAEGPPPGDEAKRSAALVENPGVVARDPFEAVWDVEPAAGGVLGIEDEIVDHEGAGRLEEVATRGDALLAGADDPGWLDVVVEGEPG